MTRFDIYQAEESDYEKKRQETAEELITLSKKLGDALDKKEELLSQIREYQLKINGLIREHYKDGVIEHGGKIYTCVYLEPQQEYALRERKVNKVN